MAELEVWRQLRQDGIISPWVFPNEHGVCFTQSAFRHPYVKHTTKKFFARAEIPDHQTG